MKITKASGQQETYSKEKFCNSLKHTGVPGALVQRICTTVEKEITPGMTTEEISQRTEKYLAKENPALAAKYSLKRGIMELGPAGFLFEQYVAAILKEYGYSVKTNQMMKGECVSHEIDVLAFTKDTHYIVEAKYHNRRGIKSDVKTAMYSFARLLDIEKHQKKKERKPAKHLAWLITNTKFTTSAITYGKCKDIKLTGWKHPKKESLENLIEAKSLYPVTVLPAINRFAKEQLAKQNIYFAKDLIHFKVQDFKKLFGIHQNIAEKITQQAKALCG